VATTTDFKRLFLRGLKWDSEDQGLTLAEALKASARAQLVEVNGGKILTQTAANGGTFTFTLPANGQGLSPSAVAETIERLLREYDAATAAVIAAGTPSPTDEQIFTEMMAQLVTVRETYADVSEIRLGLDQCLSPA
jgi:hypothetical protein